MRVALAIATLILAGCAGTAGSQDAEYRRCRELLQSEQYKLALGQIEEAIRKAEHEGDARNTWRFRLLKAETLIASRRLAEAASVLSSEPPEGPDWAEFRARDLLLRGTTAYFQAHYADAQSLLDRAREAAAGLHSPSLAAEVRLRQANLLVSQRRFDAAEPALREVVKSAAEGRDLVLEATATGSLGIMLQEEAKYDDAIVWFERARELHTKLGANRSVARDALNLGFCYHRLGDYEQAKRSYDEARSGFAKTGDLFDEQILTGDTGILLRDAGNYSAAVEAYRHAYEIARQVQNDEWTSRWATSLAELTAVMGDWDTAERYNTEALTLERRLHASEALTLCTAGRIAAGRGQFNEAERLFRAAMSQPARDPRYTLITQTELARLYEQHGQPERAEAEFQATIKSIDKLDAGLVKDDYKFGYLASLIGFYHAYVDFLMANRHPEPALAAAELSRTHVLAQRTGRSVAVPSHTTEAYQRLARQANAVLLEYWLGEDHSYLWVITPQRVRNYQLPGAKSIRALVDNYRAAILGQRNPLEAAGESGRKLYDTLLAPAAENFCQNCRVIIVPDQDLYSLNLESLPAGEGGGYWVERAHVEIAPSLDYLVDSGGQPRAPGKGLLVMGDPVPALREFPKLDYAGREMDSVRSSVGGDGAKILRGAEARADSYAKAQPGDFEFIHFSAHATANTESPLDSAVILSGSPDRCRLFARDVMAVPLKADLVTISACRSAGARTYAGEGLVGFAWAFLRAGAHNVIAGLWDVNDRSTAQLMSSMYAELARGATPAEALNSAKLALIHGGGSYAKPYYWAPFQVYTGTAK